MHSSVIQQQWLLTLIADQNFIFKLQMVFGDSNLVELDKYWKLFFKKFYWWFWCASKIEKHSLP